MTPWCNQIILNRYLVKYSMRQPITIRMNCQDLKHRWRNFLRMNLVLLLLSVHDQYMPIKRFKSIKLFSFFLLLFKYSCLHFPSTTPPTPAIPTSHPRFYPPLVLSMCLLQMFLKTCFCLFVFNESYSTTKTKNIYRKTKQFST